MDTPWSNFRWRIASWLLLAALRIAPDGTAACLLEDHLNDWAGSCRAAWTARYGKK